MSLGSLTVTNNVSITNNLTVGGTILQNGSNVLTVNATLPAANLSGVIATSAIPLLDSNRLSAGAVNMSQVQGQLPPSQLPGGLYDSHVYTNTGGNIVRTNPASFSSVTFYTNEDDYVWGSGAFAAANTLPFITISNGWIFKGTNYSGTRSVLVTIDPIGNQTNNSEIVCGTMDILGLVTHPFVDSSGNVNARALTTRYSITVGTAGNNNNFVAFTGGTSIAGAGGTLTLTTNLIVTGSVTATNGFASYAPHTPAAVTVGASPFSYTNNTTTAQECYFSGATAYAVTKMGASVYASMTGNSYFVLQPTNYCTVTYTVAPTIYTNTW